MKRTDQELSKVFRYVMEGWPIEVSDDLKVSHAIEIEMNYQWNRGVFYGAHE